MRKTFAILSSILLLSSCAKDNVDEIISNSEEVLSENCISAQIDGQEFRACGNYVGGGLTYLDDEYFAGFVLGVQYLNLENEKVITVHFSGQGNFYELQVGDEFFPVDDFGGTGVYRVESEGIDAHSDSEFYFVVTGIDHSNKVFSGEFYFTAVDTNTGISYEITNGLITNASFDE